MDYFIQSEQLRTLTPTPIQFLDLWFQRLVSSFRFQGWNVDEVSDPKDGTIIGVYRLYPVPPYRADVPSVEEALNRMRNDIFNRGQPRSRFQYDRIGWTNGEEDETFGPSRRLITYF